MINRSSRISTDEAEPGMTLAEDVLDGHGMVLLPEATVLTASIVASLQRRGVDCLHIVADVVSEAELEAERERICARLERLFRRCGGEGGSALLQQQVTAFRLGSGK